MAFFKKWKITNTRHRKLTEDWALATSLKDFSEINGNGGSTEDDDDPNNDIRTEQFCVKYLGNTIIESERSQVATADAVKTVIQTAKGLGKKLKRVNLCISPKGIDVSDYVTGEQLIQISIYKISYCSADAAHGDVFAFVGSEDLIEGTITPNNTNPIQATTSSLSSSISLVKESHQRPLEERLICYAFLCQKRKIAQKVTLTVARSFEQAYQIWRETTQRQKYLLERRMATDLLNRRRLQQSSTNFISTGGTGPSSSSSTSESTSQSAKISNGHNNELRNLLIDFSSEITAEICRKNPRDLLQNTWVSFDETNNNQQHLNSNSRDSSSGGIDGSGGRGGGGSGSAGGYMKQEVH